MILKESFLGQWQPLIFPWTRRKRLINNKPLCLAATCHLNINSVYVKYFYITTLKALNKCQGLKNYHFGSPLATKFYRLAIRAGFLEIPLSWAFLSRKNSIFLDDRAVWELKFANFITMYEVWATVTLNNFHSLPPTQILQFLSNLDNSVWNILHSTEQNQGLLLRWRSRLLSSMIQIFVPFSSSFWKNSLPKKEVFVIRKFFNFSLG